MTAFILRTKQSAEISLSVETAYLKCSEDVWLVMEPIMASDLLAFPKYSLL